MSWGRGISVGGTVDVTAVSYTARHFGRRSQPPNFMKFILPQNTHKQFFFGKAPWNTNPHDAFSREHRGGFQFNFYHGLLFFSTRSYKTQYQDFEAKLHWSFQNPGKWCVVVIPHQTKVPVMARAKTTGASDTNAFKFDVSLSSGT